MKLKIEIELDNAAFEPPTQGAEVARILRGFSEDVEYETVANFARPLLDINGNRVGEAKVTR